MTGTGTQADPLCPTNWQELIEAVGTEGAYVSCPANEVWDMNKIDPTGVSSIIPWNAVEVQGNGLSIKNLLFKTSIHFSNKDILQEVYKLNFLNMYDGGGVFSAFYYGGYQHPVFKNCQITGQFSEAWFFNGIDFSHDGEKSCLIAANLLGSATLAYNSCKFLGCKIDLSGNTTATMDPGWCPKADFCYFTGTNPYKKLRLAYQSRNNVFDMVVPENTELTYDYTYGGFIGVFNSDKMYGDYNGLYKPVTTAQLTDVAYLQSIGFNAV